MKRERSEEQTVTSSYFNVQIDVRAGFECNNNELTVFDNVARDESGGPTLA